MVSANNTTKKTHFISAEIYSHKKDCILYVGIESTRFKEEFIEQNCDFIIANNTLEAVAKLQSGLHPTTIICEYHLTGNNGLYLFDFIQSYEAYCDIPFILLCSQFSSELYKLALEKKVNDFYVTNVVTANDLIVRAKYFNSEKSNLGINNETKEVFTMPFSKRLFDVVVAVTALLCIAPLLLLVIIAIRIESKGKVYFTSKRVGRKVFNFYKLRSMRVGAENELQLLAKEKNQYKNIAVNTIIQFDVPCPRCTELPTGQSCSPKLYIDHHNICDYWYNHQKQETAQTKPAFVKIVNDPRVTRVGKFIRNTSIDELPQLLNVIKGDMSIVGNRPLPVYEAEQLTRDDLSKRFLAPAGITGLWQVELRGKGGKMSEEERKKLDNEYADHFKDGSYSFWYDMKLIMKTIPALLQKSTV